MAEEDIPEAGLLADAQAADSAKAEVRADPDSADPDSAVLISAVRAEDGAALYSTGVSPVGADLAEEAEPAAFLS